MQSATLGHTCAVWEMNYSASVGTHNLQETNMCVLMVGMMYIINSEEDVYTQY